MWPVFAKAAEIANYLKTVLSSNRAAKIDNLDITISSRASQVQTDSISGRIGLSSDAAGTTTLFARAKQIYDYLTTHLSSTRTAKIDNLDATMSSRAAASSLTALDNKVGTANPTSAGTDTVFKYLKKLDNHHLMQYTSFSREGNINLAASAWGTALQVTGEGFLTRFYSTDNRGIKITVDGVLVLHLDHTFETRGLISLNDVVGIHPASTYDIRIRRPHSQSTDSGVTVRSLPYTTTGTNGLVILDSPLFFNSSLLLEIRNPYGSTSSIPFSIGGASK